MEDKINTTPQTGKILNEEELVKVRQEWGRLVHSINNAQKLMPYHFLRGQL